MDDPPHFRCGACPPGSTGNGTSCHDLDEVSISVFANRFSRKVYISPSLLVLFNILYVGEVDLIPCTLSLPS